MDCAIVALTVIVENLSAESITVNQYKMMTLMVQTVSTELSSFTSL